MKISISMDGDVVIMDITGDLVASTADDLKAQVSKLSEKRFHFILADISKIKFMDSSGLGACMAIHKSLSEKNGLLVLAKPSDAVAKIFRITRADQKLKVTATQQEGMKYIHDAIIGERNHLKMTLGQDFKEVDSVRSTLRGFCESIFTEKKHRSALDDFYLATAEAMNNAVEHFGAKAIEVEVAVEADGIIFTLITPGNKFDPTAKRTMPDLESAEGLPEGGFGLAIIQKLMDTMTYEYRDGKNILTLNKKMSTQNKS